MRKLQKFYVTFKPRNRWIRFSDRFYVINATSLDQARKEAINMFDKDWLDIYNNKDWKEFDSSKLTQIETYEVKRNLERETRIRYKSYREKEDNGKK